MQLKITRHLRKQKPQETNKDRASRKIEIPAALIIAGLPIIANVMLFIYKFGFFTYFKIPSQLIEFQLAEVFGITLAFAFVLISLFILIDLVYGLIDISYIYYKIRVIFSGIFFIFFILLGLGYLLLAGEDIKALAFFSLALIILLPRLSSLKIIKQPRIFNRIDDFLNKLIGKKIPNRVFEESLTNKIGYGPTTFILSITLLALSFYFTGDYEASSKKVFDVIQLKPECVIVATYPDKVICLPFNSQKQEIDDGYKVIRFQDIDGTVIKPMYTGLIKINKVLNPPPPLIITPTLPIPTITLSVTETPTPIP